MGAPSSPPEVAPPRRQVGGNAVKDPCPAGSGTHPSHAMYTAPSCTPPWRGHTMSDPIGVYMRIFASIESCM